MKIWGCCMCYDMYHDWNQQSDTWLNLDFCTVTGFRRNQSCNMQVWRWNILEYRNQSGAYHFDPSTCRRCCTIVLPLSILHIFGCIFNSIRLTKPVCVCVSWSCLGDCWCISHCCLQHRSDRFHFWLFVLMFFNFLFFLSFILACAFWFSTSWHRFRLHHVSHQPLLSVR